MKLWKLTLGTALLAMGTGAATAPQAQAQAVGATAMKPSMAAPITLTGIVGGSPMAKEFFLRANGETFRVQPLAKVGMTGIRGGDRVRVFGRPTGLIISHANVRVLSSRASDSPSDYTAGQTTIQLQPSRRNGGPARSTTNQNAPTTQNSTSGMAMPDNSNQPAFNRSRTGVTTPGVVNPGIVAPGVIVPNGVVPGVVAPNIAVANAIRRRITK